MADTSNALRQWVDTQWPHLTLNDFLLRRDFEHQPNKAPAWQALGGDAGFRRYYRLASEPPLLAVYAPPQTEKNQAFMHIARLLRQGGVLTPAIAAYDLERGFFLIEDFGPTLLLDVLSESNAERHYELAIETLLSIARCEPDQNILPPYDRTCLHEEMALFPQWFVEQLLDYSLDDSETAMLERTFAVLEDNATEQPQVVVHRDFHSRNLVAREAGPPGVIDFQDGVIGPVTYDLVSLLRDCYIQWPEQKVYQWMHQYLDRANALGICDNVSAECFTSWFDLMGLQRHIKVLGIFARLSLRDQKHRYLNDLPLVIRYTLSVAEKYAALTEFTDWFEAALMPRIQEQPWWPEQS